MASLTSSHRFLKCTSAVNRTCHERHLHYYRQKTPVIAGERGWNKHVCARTIVVNPKLIERGDHDMFGSGFARDGGLDGLGEFKDMDKYMIDYVPEYCLDVVASLPELSITNAWPTTIIAHTFNNIQMITGLPWYATIAITASLVKLSLYPVHVWWRREFQDLVKTSPPQLASFFKEYFSHVIQAGPQEALRKAYEARVQTCKELNLPLYPALFPMYTTLITPVFMTLGLCYLTNLTYQPLIEGGCLWFPNLTEVDPYWALPVINSLLIIANAKFHPFGLLLPKPIFIMGFKAQAPLGILTFLQLWCSTGVLLYWASANFTGLIIQLLLRNSTVREYHGLETKLQLFEPLITQGQTYKELGDQIETARTQHEKIKQAEIKLLSERSDEQSFDLNKPNGF